MLRAEYWPGSTRLIVHLRSRHFPVSCSPHATLKHFIPLKSMTQGLSMALSSKRLKEQKRMHFNLRVMGLCCITSLCLLKRRWCCVQSVCHKTSRQEKSVQLTRFIKYKWNYEVKRDMKLKGPWGNCNYEILFFWWNLYLFIIKYLS